MAPVSQDILQLPGCLEPVVMTKLANAKLTSASALLALPDKAARVKALVDAGVSEGESISGSDSRVPARGIRGAPILLLEHRVVARSSCNSSVRAPCRCT